MKTLSPRRGRPSGRPDERRKHMSDITRRAFGRTGLLGLAGLAVANAETVTPHAKGAHAGAALSYRYIHLDVFTDRRMEGNQLFVFTQPAGLDTDTMQTMTRES